MTSAVPHEETAGHVGEEFDETRAALRGTLGKAAALDYLAHYSGGVFNVGIDLLGDPPSPKDAPPGRTRRDELRRMGRWLSHTTSGLDRTLQRVRTGALIRTVVHTEHGAGVCNLVVPREYVVGSVLGTEVPSDRGDLLTHVARVQTADMAMAELATRLRRRISLSSANPGGWETADAPGPPAPRSPGDPFGTVLTELDERTGRLKEACERAVRPSDLHLVAYCTPSEVAFAVDQFGDRSLAQFFVQITVTARRAFYLEFSRELYALASTFNRAASGVLRGQLLRLVLDMEQGAIYFYRLEAGAYLVGVTIDQSRVSAADDQMARLALRVRDLLAE